MAREITMGAATSIGTLEYQLFADWYMKTYKKEPPENNADIANNTVYVWWKDNLRSNQWSPAMETQATADWFQQSRLSPGTVTPQPPALPQTKGSENLMPEVVSQGGYDWYPMKDLDGNILSWEIIGKTPQEDTGKMTAYQQAQFDWQKELADKELERQRLGTEMEQAGLARQRLVNWASRSTASDLMQQKSQWWDELRTQMMDELQPVPSQWLNYQQLKIKRNPYAQAETNADWLAKAKERADTAKELLKDATDREKTAAKNPNISLTPADKEFISFVQGEYQAATDELDRAQTAWATQVGASGQTSQSMATPRLEGYQETDQGLKPYYSVGGDSPEPTPARGVATPDWMPRYVSQLRGQEWIPGTGNVGGKITEVNPLSGQAASRLSPSKLEMMKGLVSFTGQEPSDWLHQASVQTPKNISLGRTWGAFR